MKCVLLTNVMKTNIALKQIYTLTTLLAATVEYIFKTATLVEAAWIIAQPCL